MERVDRIKGRKEIIVYIKYDYVLKYFIDINRKILI